MNMNPTWTCLFALIFVSGCAMHETKAPQGLTFDEKSQLFTVNVVNVTRGELLHQLRLVADIEVRPLPTPADRLTIHADGLDTDELLVRVLPADRHYVVRRGARDVAALASRSIEPKDGPPLAAAAQLPAKSAGALKRSASRPLKAATPTSIADAPVKRNDPMLKAPADALLGVTMGTGAKTPLHACSTGVRTRDTCF